MTPEINHDYVIQNKYNINSGGTKVTVINIGRENRLDSALILFHNKKQKQNCEIGWREFVKECNEMALILYIFFDSVKP